MRIAMSIVRDRDVSGGGVGRLVSLGIFEFGTGLERSAGGSRQDQLSFDQLELRNRNGNIVLGDMKVTAGIDDGVGNRLVGRDDDVVDISDPLVLVIVDWRAENLALGTPTGRDVAQLRRFDTN